MGEQTTEATWLKLPSTPTLPKARHTGSAPVNGVRIWYAVFGKGKSVILLHGGLGNSNYWGNQVRVLSKLYQVIVMDSRGHGRSSRIEEPLSYHLMASDVVALMDFLKIKKAAIIGWSDGANVTPRHQRDARPSMLSEGYLTRRVLAGGLSRKRDIEGKEAAGLDVG